jgi:hypothetical protein
MAGLLGAKYDEWMTPERSIKMGAYGDILSGLGSGQSVNLAPAYQALQKRKQDAAWQERMNSGEFAGMFDERQMKALASGPTDWAKGVIHQRMFAAPAAPAKFIIEELGDGRKYYVDPTGRTPPRLVNPGVGAPVEAYDYDAEEARRKEYNSLSTVKEFQKQATAYGKIVTAAGDATGASDVALIFSYMKVLDPGSTVREGEFATAQETAGIPGKISSLYNKAVDGRFLTPIQRANFLEMATKLYDSQEGGLASVEQQYEALAERQGLDIGSTILDYRTPQRETHQIGQDVRDRLSLPQLMPTATAVNLIEGAD